MRFNKSFRGSIILKKKIYEKILMSYVGLKSFEAEQLLNINGKNNETNKWHVLNKPRYQIINNCLLCRKFNVNVRPIDELKYCLALNNHTLQHRINILKDIGVQELNISLLNKLMSILNKPLFKFKELTNMPIEYDISKNIFNRLNESPIDIPQLNQSKMNKWTMKKYYDTCLLHCKTQIFDLPYIDDKALLGGDLKLKSISMIADTLKVLRLELGYDEKIIKKYPFVITASADNIKLLLNKFKDTDICGMSIVELLRNKPYMLFENVNNIEQLLMLFKRYKIPNEYVKKFTRIFTITSDVFEERIKWVNKHPDLYLWRTYPRILRLIFHKNMVSDRVEYLRFLNRINWARLHTVLVGKNYMNRYIQYNVSTLISKKSLKHVLADELGSDEIENLTKLLMKHPYWKTAGFIDIKNMLKYLKMNFTLSEIRQNIHIILYAQSVIEKMLAELREQYSQNTEISFSNGQYLALCLYMLEKDNHFMGDSIWSYGHNVKLCSSLQNENVTMDNGHDTSIAKNIGDLNIKYNIDHDLDDENRTFDETRQ